MTSSHSPHTAPANHHLPSTCRFLSQDFCNVFRPRPCFHTLDMNTLLIHDALIISCEFLCKRYKNTSSLSHPYGRLFLQAQPQSESDTGNSPARRMPWSDSTGQPCRGACRGTHPAKAAFSSLLASCLNSDRNEASLFQPLRFYTGCKQQKRNQTVADFISKGVYGEEVGTHRR